MLSAVLDDIRTRDEDVIVCACGPHVHIGSTGGLAKVIENAAGPRMKHYCVEHELAIHYGETVWTPSYDLPCKELLHAVGPRWLGGDQDERRTLHRVHRSIISEVLGKGYGSVVIPAISCGIYGFPFQIAAPIAVGAVREELEAQGRDLEVVWSFTDERHFGTWQRALTAT